MSWNGISSACSSWWTLLSDNGLVLLLWFWFTKLRDFWQLNSSVKSLSRNPPVDLSNLRKFFKLTLSELLSLEQSLLIILCDKSLLLILLRLALLLFPLVTFTLFSYESNECSIAEILFSRFLPWPLTIISRIWMSWLYVKYISNVLCATGRYNDT
jgi:hypothetical protein